jgi:ureidoacrylate peracid hydrolase
MARGTRDWEICEELAPGDGDLIVDKTRYSALHGTGLAGLLRERGVTLIVVAGATTNMCVDSTAPDAFTLDFKVMVLEDCAGAPRHIMQRGPLESFLYGFGDVAPSQVRLDALKSGLAGE